MLLAVFSISSWNRFHPVLPRNALRSKESEGCECRSLCFEQGTRWEYFKPLSNAPIYFSVSRSLRCLAWSRITVHWWVHGAAQNRIWPRRSSNSSKFFLHNLFSFVRTHPCNCCYFQRLNFIDVATGSLGQGLSVSCGRLLFTPVFTFVLRYGLCWKVLRQSTISNLLLNGRRGVLRRICLGSSR